MCIPSAKKFDASKYSAAENPDAPTTGDDAALKGRRGTLLADKAEVASTSTQKKTLLGS